tara:strand:- start:3951 stop:4250 length:300 start_codon:yes stop_codon:yes gene_type:complete
MSTHIESLMRNSAITHNGWTKTFISDNSYRVIRIGSQINCNGDGLICDPSTCEKIRQILDKYNVVNYEIKNIHNESEYSTQILMKEDVYNEFIKKINNI